MSFCHDDDYAELYEIKEKNKRQSARRMLPTIREIKEVSVVMVLAQNWSRFTQVGPILHNSIRCWPQLELIDTAAKNLVLHFR